MWFVAWMLNRWAEKGAHYLSYVELNKKFVRHCKEHAADAEGLDQLREELASMIQNLQSCDCKAFQSTTKTPKITPRVHDLQRFAR